jgi:hypothetical protein
VYKREIDTRAPPLRIHDADGDLSPIIKRHLIGDRHGHPCRTASAKARYRKGARIVAAPHKEMPKASNQAMTASHLFKIRA